MAASPMRNLLVLPKGSKPDLGKDEGKHISPTKANFGFASESAKEQKVHHTENAVGRERERSVSPNGRPRYTSVLGQPSGHGRLSPSPAASPIEGQSGMKRDLSVEDRLKALMEGASTRSRASSAFLSLPYNKAEAVEEIGREARGR